MPLYERLLHQKINCTCDNKTLFDTTAFTGKYLVGIPLDPAFAHAYNIQNATQKHIHLSSTYLVLLDTHYTIIRNIRSEAPSPYTRTVMYMYTVQSGFSASTVLYIVILKKDPKIISIWSGMGM
jgi:hypothetical protein